MKFIHNDFPHHNPIDMAKVEHIQRNKYNGNWGIIFNFNRGCTSWDYDSKRERDIAYDQVLTAVGSQDISKIITTL